MPDEELTPEYMLENLWVVGDSRRGYAQAAQASRGRRRLRHAADACATDWEDDRQKVAGFHDADERRGAAEPTVENLPQSRVRIYICSFPSETRNPASASNPPQPTEQYFLHQGGHLIGGHAPHLARAAIAMAHAFGGRWILPLAEVGRKQCQYPPPRRGSSHRTAAGSARARRHAG